MPETHSTYNPGFLPKDKPSWFKDFVMLQDEVPYSMITKKEDSLFLKHHIIQQKDMKPGAFRQSIFIPHLLKPTGMVTRERHNSNYGWIAGIIALCFVLYAIAHFGYYRRMRQIFKAYFAHRLFSQLTREGGILSERSSLFLIVSFFLGLSLFIYKICEFYYMVPSSFLRAALFYAEILAGVFAFYIIKIGLYNLSAFIFKIKREVSDYILNIYISSQIAGIILLPVIVLTTYMPGKYVIYAGLASLLLVYLYSLYRALTTILSKVKISLYYLFLYLCTLEILPLFLIAKVLSKYFL